MPTRRRFLAGSLAGGVVGLADGAAATAESDARGPEDASFDAFVETDGTEFVVDGETAYFNGGSHPQLRRRSDLVEPFFEEWEELAPNMSWLRVPAFATGTTRPLVPLMPEPGEYNEEGFAILDEIVAEANRRGVRLVFILSNYWGWYGGVPQYLEWDPDAATKDDFYTSEDTREWYRDYVEFVLNWENTITGVQYKDDPTIMMWELMNEPRVQADPAALVGWVDEMSGVIAETAPNQLVSPGTGGGPAWNVPDWYHDVYAIDTVDAWSFHVWADPNHQDIGQSGGVDWIRNHTRAAHEAGMPAYSGEFGWRVHPDRQRSRAQRQLRERNRVFEAWYEAMDDAGTNGAMIWDLRADEEYPIDWNPYAVFPRDEGTPEIVDRWSDRFAEKSRPVTTPTPTPTPSPTPTREPTPSPTPTRESTPSPTPTPTEGVTPGFGPVATLAALAGSAYYLARGENEE